MKFFKILCSVLAAGVGLASCQNVDFKKTTAGVPYKIFGSQKRDTLATGTVVRYMVIQKVGDSVLFSSYKDGNEQSFSISPFRPSLQYVDTKPNMEEILRSAKKGDSVYMVQETDSIIKKNPQSDLKKGQQLITTAKVIGVYKNQEEAQIEYYKEHIPTKEQLATMDKQMRQGFEGFMRDSVNQASMKKDDAAIEAYLKAHNLQARKSDWGIYVEDLVPGQGPNPVLQQFTTVNYKGMTLSGEVFDQGQLPNVQIGGQGSIPGFWLGIREIKKGGKARIYIPSLLGYGMQGNPPKIKPNEVLVFELELLNISDVPSPQPQQQQQQQLPH